MPRLFTGLEIPAELRDEIARLKVPLPGGRWTEPDNLHLTLRFVTQTEFRNDVAARATPRHPRDR